MADGWIKIHRKIMDWEWYDNQAMVQIWVHLLLEANYEPKKWHGITIERGQLVTTLDYLSSTTGLSVQQTRTCLDRLASSQQITRKSTNKYTIITICNYDSYQSIEDAEQQTNNNQITNEQQTNNKQITTTKEYKEREEIQNNITPPIIPPKTDGRIGFEFFGTFHNVELRPAEHRKLQMDFGEEETQSAIDDLSCKLMDGTQQSNAHYATLVYWLSNRRKKKSRVDAEPKGRDIIGNDNEFTTD